MALTQFVWLLFLAALWGGSFLFMRVAVSDFGAVPIIQLRIGIAALCLLPFFGWQQYKSTKKQSLRAVDWWHLFFVGVSNSVLPFTLIAFATQYIGAGYAALLNSSVPMWSALIGIIWLKDRVSFWQWLGMSMSFTGMIILIGGQGQAAPSEAVLSLPVVGELPAVLVAVIASTLATVSYGISANYSKRFVSHISPMSVSTLTLTLGSLAMLPWAVSTWEGEPASMRSWVCVVLLGALCTAFCFVIFYRLMQEIGPTKTVSVTFLVPIFGVLWGWWLLNEHLTVSMIAGAIVILGGTLLVLNIWTPRKLFQRFSKRQIAPTESGHLS